MFSFEEKLKFGEEGEQIVASALIARGSAVSPLYQFTADCAPFLLTRERKVILPDLTCWSDGENYFVECKRKNQWVEWGGVYETGLNQRHFADYERVKAVTGQRVYLFFLHEDARPEFNGLFYGEIHKIKPLARLWDGLKPSGKPAWVEVNGQWQKQQPLILFPHSALHRMEMLETA